MNKLIVVTGGTKGIGRAIIEKFASVGFDIVTCARNSHDLGEMKDALDRQYRSIKVVTHPTDMSDKKQVKSFCSAVLDLGRPVDVLVNNAGYFAPGEITTEPEGAL